MEEFKIKLLERIVVKCGVDDEFERVFGHGEVLSAVELNGETIARVEFGEWVIVKKFERTFTQQQKMEMLKL